MTNYDFSPFWRSTVGFDRLFSMLEDDSLRVAGEPGYPPYNIERTGEDDYEITLALAGFTPDEISITTDNNVLTIEGRKAEKREHQYLYQGISARPFRRQFNLADYVRVSDAWFENGLLHVNLVRELPEAMKPRRVEITSGPARKVRQMDHKKAA